MRNICIISLWIWICFVIEYFLGEWVSPWLRPNVLLILVIFFNLYRGIRHSLLVAFIAGIIQDSFAPQLFGLNVFTLMACAYLTTFLKMYIYESGSAITRLLLIFLTSIFYVLIGFWTRLIFIPLDFWGAFRFILLPEVFATTAAALFVFKVFKQCALKFFA